MRAPQGAAFPMAAPLCVPIPADPRPPSNESRWSPTSGHITIIATLRAQPLDRDPTPSPDDLQLTRLVDAGTLIGIPVLDHIVIADAGFVRLHARGHW